MVLAQNTHIDHWNRIENPEINPYSYRYSILYKCVKNVLWRKDSLFNMVLRKFNMHKLKSETLSLSPFTKITSKWINSKWVLM
jgi:hypothetical protein